MRRPRLSAIVCTKDRPDQLRLVLLGLAAQDVRPDEVVVSDAGSAPAADVVKELAPLTGLQLRYTHHATSEFHAAATRNAGFLRATGEWVLFLDGDVVPLPGVVRRHLAACGDERTVLAGGYVRLDPERTERITPEAVMERRLARFLLAEDFKRLHHWHRKNRFYDLIRHPRRPQLHSGHFSVATSAMMAVNGFDESFTGWGQEDDDLRERLVCSGARIGSLVASAVGLHLWHERAPGAFLFNNAVLLTKGRPVRCARGLETEGALGAAGVGA
ncbi:MAG: glycosyltransferase [Planctomycetota bacterium]